MKVAMLDPSLFTGRYDDSLCEALARRGHEVRLLGRPMRATDAASCRAVIFTVPRFFRLGEGARTLLGDGLLGKAVKAAEYSLDAVAGPLDAPRWRRGARAMAAVRLGGREAARSPQALAPRSSIPSTMPRPFMAMRRPRYRGGAISRCCRASMR